MPSEAVALGEAIEAVQRPKAVEARKAGKSADGKAGGRGKKKNLAPNQRKVSREPETTRVAAKAAGMSRPTYERAKAVCVCDRRQLDDADAEASPANPLFTPTIPPGVFHAPDGKILRR